MKTQTVFERKLLNLNNHPIIQYEDLFNSLDIQENTRKDYLYRVPHFIAFVKNEGFSHETYLRYKKYLSTLNTLSISTKNKLLITAKILLRELTKRGVIPDITINVRLFSDTRKHKRAGIDEGEMNTILSYLIKLEVTQENLRLKSLFALLIYQGLRISEIVTIALRDVDLIRNTLHVKGKGNDHKELVYLNPKTVNIIKQYLDMHRLSDGWLFPCQSNNGRGKHMTTRTMQNLITAVLSDLNISKSCHAFRHYFVTRLIQEYKSDLTQVMVYSRHKTLSMLTVYNDMIRHEKDLPKFYHTFQNVDL